MSTPSEVIRKAREHNITMAEAKRLLNAVAAAEQKKAAK